MALDNDEKLVEGTVENGIAWNGSQYIVLFKGDRIGAFGTDIDFARRTLADKNRGI